MFERIVACAAVAAFAWGAGTHASAQSPRWYHVKGGQIEGVAFYAGDTSRGATAEEGGKVRWTDDGGATWNPATVPDEVRGELRGVYFLDANNAWMCGDGGVVLKSTNGGQNWSLINGSDLIYDNDATPKLAGLWDIHMINSNDGWVVGFDGAIERTTNGGASWEWPTGWTLPEEFGSEFLFDIYDVHYFDSTHGMLCTDWGRVFLNNPSNGQWTNNPTAIEDVDNECPVFQGHNIELWSMAFDDPTNYQSNVWLAGGVGTQNGYLYRYTGGSTWGGGSWAQSRCYDFVDPSDANSPLCGLSTQYGIAVLGSSDPKAIDVGYAAQIFRYRNGTANFNPCDCEAEQGNCSSNSPTWIQETQPNPDEDPPGGYEPLLPLLHVAKLSSTTACIVGRFGQILYYDENGGTPAIADVGGTTLPVRLSDGDFIDDANDDTGCIVGQFHIIKKTDDGGATWTDVTASGTFDLDGYGWGLDLSTTGQYGIAVGAAGFIARSSDYGDTWADESGNYSDLQAVAFVPSSTWAYAVGASGTVLKTENAGDSWTSVSVGSGDTLYGVSFISTTTGYVVGTNSDGSSAVAYKTTNSGANWTTMTISTPPTVPAAFRDVETWGDGSVAIAVGDRGAIYQSSGSSFSVIGSPPSPAPSGTLFDVQVLYTAPSTVNLRIAGSRGYVLFRDSGSWTTPKSQTSESIYRLSFMTGSKGYGIGQQGLIIDYH